MAEARNVTAIERAFAILEYLEGSRRGLNISEISRKLSIPKSSAHVIMLTLERLGYVQKRPESLQYTVSVRAHAFGVGLHRNMLVSDAALPHMKNLVSQVHLPAHLAIPDGDQGVYIQKVEPEGASKIDTYIGRRMDLHCTGVGKVILAFGPPSLLERTLARGTYIRHTPSTITSAKELEREISAVRRMGYAVDDEEEELAVRCVAVPVFQPDGRFAAALSVTGSVTDIPAPGVEQLSERLRDTAGRVFAPLASPQGA